MNNAAPEEGLRNLGASIYNSMKDDFFQSVSLFFSPFVVLKNDFLNSASILKTFEPSSAATKIEPSEGKGTARADAKATVVADAMAEAFTKLSLLSSAEASVLAVGLAKDFAEKQKLAWRTSTVALMKVLDLDSSMRARKQLAKELGYEGDTRDFASMNKWLHGIVIQKLADRDPGLTRIVEHRATAWTIIKKKHKLGRVARSLRGTKEPLKKSGHSSSDH